MGGRVGEDVISEIPPNSNHPSQPQPQPQGSPTITYYKVPITQ